MEHVSPFVKGVLVCSPVWGEGIHLSLDKKKSLIREAWDCLDRGISFLIGITGSSQAQTGELVSWVLSRKDEFQAKNPLYLVDYPLYYHSNRKLPQYLEDLTRQSDIPVILGNDPALITGLGQQAKRVNIRTSVLSKIGSNHNIKALIYSGETRRLFHYQGALKTRRDFLFYDGDESRFLNGPGRAGVVSVGSNILPQQWNEITVSSMHPENQPERFEPGKVRTLELGRHFMDLCRLYHDAPAAAVKYALTILGIIRYQTVSPHGSPVTEARCKQIKSKLKEFF